jgi:hypothetical protein
VAVSITLAIKRRPSFELVMSRDAKDGKLQFTLGCHDLKRGRGGGAPHVTAAQEPGHVDGTVRRSSAATGAVQIPSVCVRGR